MLRNYICKECKKKFTGVRSKNKARKYFCSKRCYRIDIKKRKSIQKSCEECGKQIRVSLSLHKRGDGVYCGVRCHSKGSAKKRTKKKSSYKCKFCKIKVYVTPSTLNFNKCIYCSRACYRAALKAKRMRKCKKCKQYYDTRGGGRFFCSRRCQLRHRGMNSIESKIADLLRGNKVTFVTNANPLRRFTYPDFLLRKQNIAIYVDGDYWHRNQAKKDELQTKVLRALGLKVLRIRERDINNKIGSVEKRIVRALQL